MNNRLLQFLSAENITQSQFADEIEVTRASVSHILAGRNKPGYDFIVNIMRHYPELNIDWLLCGKGKMYRMPVADNARDLSHSSNGRCCPSPDPSPSGADDDDLLFHDVETFAESPVALQVSEPQEKIKSSCDINTSINPCQSIVNKRSIVKIIALYDDGSFQEMQ